MGEILENAGDRGELGEGEGVHGWSECMLGEIITLQRGFDITQKHQEPGDYPVVSSSGIKSYHNEWKVKGPGVVIGRKGTLGTVFYLDRDFWPHDTTLWIKDFHGNSPLFISYFLKEFDLGLYDVGSSNPTLNRNHVHLLPASLPPLSEQKAIANLLSSLDDKIDLLHRQNQTLEAMAETLFRQWFVEEAQEDWEEVRLSDICSIITKGTTPTSLGYQFTESGINFIKAESITDEGNFITDKFAKISEETHQILRRSIIQSGDVLCSIAGTIGRVAIADNSILPANTNQAIAIIRVNYEKCFSAFIYLFLKSEIFQEIMDGKIVHAVQPNLSLGEIGNTTLKLPLSSVLHEFKEMIEPIFDRKRHNILQIRTLEKLRDTLLPKLMSGEVRVEL